MKSSIHTLVYATVLGTVCALLLTGVGRFTAPYREANAKAEEVRNILSVLGMPFDPEASSENLVALFKDKVRTQERGSLTLYVYRNDDDTLQAVAVPFSGPGLWGPIEGILSLEPDMRTIRGVTFYKQEETPGLGGEIASPRFRDQFTGKSIVDFDGKPGIHLRRGGRASGSNEVDAITGATMTCDKVEAMLNKVIVQIVKERNSNAR